MNTTLRLLILVATAGLLAACGDSSGSIQNRAPDPTAQPEAQSALFRRTCDRVKVLIAHKNYQQAKEAIDLFKNYKLTPEQEKVVELLKAQIPKGK
jgi:outer membrane PBP1 activator LpoA protein